MRSMMNARLVVLLADPTQRHVAIEVAPTGATAIELAALARKTSDRVGFEMTVYAVLPTRDHPCAVVKARELLRFSQAKIAA
jgi:hypothetical protein